LKVCSAAAYSSVSAVTFVAAVFLEMQNYTFSGHVVAVMALMEAPAIIIGVILVKIIVKGKIALQNKYTNKTLFYKWKCSSNTW
jgi:hypothetical protein